MIEASTASPSRSRCIAWRKRPSIFTMSSGRTSRVDIEAYQVPKPSTPIAGPNERRWLNRRGTPMCASPRVCSVNSNPRAPGGSPRPDTRPATSTAKSGRVSWSAVTFTHSRGGRMVVPDAISCHVRASATAVRSTQRPTCSDRPAASATGMNCAGLSRPRSGCCQRRNASIAGTDPLRRSTSGW